MALEDLHLKTEDSSMLDTLMVVYFTSFRNEILSTERHIEKSGQDEVNCCLFSLVSGHCLQLLWGTHTCK